MRNLTILGSTGTIGVNTLDVIRKQREHFSVFALTAYENVDDLFSQCEEWNPPYAVMVEEKAAIRLRKKIQNSSISTEVLSGVDNLEMVASDSGVDFVMAGIVGAAGLLPTLAAAKSGKRVMLANKEALVMSGKIFMDAIREGGAEILPIDSEHNAIFQCMPHDLGDGERINGVRKILLTASGGPFRNSSLEALSAVSPQEACAHPNWQMGRKISVDSATMMNKGLEIIEACWLFDTTPAKIQVVVHPQSIVHSMVEYVDGSVLAQLGNPDMRTPIAYALAWPDRFDSGVAPLDFFQIKGLHFEQPDRQRFPCLGLAERAAIEGGTAPTILNATNEIAVQSFLENRLDFMGIPRLVRAVLEDSTFNEADSLETILYDDQLAREKAIALIDEGKI